MPLQPSVRALPGSGRALYQGGLEHRFVTDAVFDGLEAAGFFLGTVALPGLPYRYALSPVHECAPRFRAHRHSRSSSSVRRATCDVLRAGPITDTFVPSAFTANRVPESQLDWEQERTIPVAVWCRPLR